MAKQKMNKRHGQKQREKIKLKEQIKAVKPRPPWWIKVPYFIFVSKFGVIPAAFIVIKLTENTILTRTDWGGFVIFGLMMFLWVFIGLTSTYWYSRRYKEYLELKKKLKNI